MFRLVLSLESIIKQWRRDWRNHAISGAVGAFLALAGAFETQRAPLSHRLVFWILLLVAGSLCASFISTVTSQRPRLGQNRFLTWSWLTLLITIPMSLLSWTLGAVLFGIGPDSVFLFFVWVSAVISGSMTALMMLINTPGPATEGAAHSNAAGGIRFMARLPHELKGASIYAVSAEDHYLRIHSSKGTGLILSRLSDAVSELDGIEGAQVHRSWWVARGGIAEVHRMRNRVQLELKNGVVAPVSRPNVKALQASGWI